MPIRNEAGYIERSLGSVLAQDYPADRIQILVVDGMSDDDTRAIVQEMMMDEVETFERANVQTSSNVMLLDNPQRIVPTAMNIGLAQASGDVIIRIDGHCEIPSDYISTCVRKLCETGVECVGGPIETVSEGMMAESIAVAMSSPFGVGGSTFRTGASADRLVDTLAFGAYTREAIERTGPFDEELVRNQDDEYNYRLRKLGGRILLTNELSSRYYSRGSLPKLWRQYYQYGYYKVRVLQKHPRQMQPRQFAPPAFAATVLGGATIAALQRITRQLNVRTLKRLNVLTFLVLGLYCAANIAASVVTATRRGWKHLPLLPIVFATLHLSYGFGFLAGLVAFRDRWGEDE